MVSYVQQLKNQDGAVIGWRSTVGEDTTDHVTLQQAVDWVVFITKEKLDTEILPWEVEVKRAPIFLI